MTETSSNMSTQSSDVYQEIEKIIRSYFFGISMSHLSWLERCYQQKFKRSPDYVSLGVKNIKQLLDKMCRIGLVLVCEAPKSNQKYVMSSRVVESRRKFLKHDVQELLDEYGGEIPLSSFEVIYRDKFQLNLDYRFYCLKDFDNLCEALNLVVEAAKSGKKVIKAHKIYNLRKRKI